MSGINGGSFTVVGKSACISGVTRKFSSHLAAFEACMRIREADWTPIGGGTYFKDSDKTSFAYFKEQIARKKERAQCP